MKSSKNLLVLIVAVVGLGLSSSAFAEPGPSLDGIKIEMNPKVSPSVRAEFNDMIAGTRQMAAPTASRPSPASREMDARVLEVVRNNRERAAQVPAAGLDRASMRGQAMPRFNTAAPVSGGNSRVSAPPAAAAPSAQKSGEKFYKFK